jgi:hypothetical protein
VSIQSARLAGDRDTATIQGKMNNSTSRREVSVVLSGGLGDHLLGMRVLRFIRDRYPSHDIVAYSDSTEGEAPLKAALMSPLVSRAVPIHRAISSTTLPAPGAGPLDDMRPDEASVFMPGDLQVNARSEGMFVDAAVRLGIPFFDILAHRLELTVPPHAVAKADQMLAPFGDAIFIGVNLAMPGAEAVRQLAPRVERLLEPSSLGARIVVLNIPSPCEPFLSVDPAGTFHRQHAAEEVPALESLGWPGTDFRSCASLPVETVAALLARCRYFVGVDNGVKHLAWALGVPHSFFCQAKPALFDALRWMPDLHRILLFDCADVELDAHTQTVASLLHNLHSTA